MADYIPSTPDYIPEIQQFNPNLNYYAGALATKQSQYDQGLAKVSSLYNSAFNSPMSRTDNIERRDKYFKTIEQQVQKTAQMDLSIDSNVNSAQALFDPLLNDKYIIKDISYTKGLQNSFQRAEQFRNCVDPEKCGGSFWEEGVQALQYAQEEFKNANPDDSLKYSAPEYVPFQNVTQKAIKAAKDAGFNVSYDHKSRDGRYIVTDTNGQLLLGENGQGVLPQYLYGMFGNDSSIQKMYSTQAYVQRKNYAEANAYKFAGSKDAAESEYLHSVMLKTVPKIEKAKAELTSIREDAKVGSKSLEILAQTNPSDDVNEAYQQLQNILATTEPAEAYHEQVSNAINTAPNLNDVKSLRSRVDNIVANANFMDNINAAAYSYAMGTAKHDEKADPYALASFNSALDISKHKQEKLFDQELWIQQNYLEGKIDIDAQGKPVPITNAFQGVNGLVGNSEIAQRFNSIPEDVRARHGITPDKKGLQKAIALKLLAVDPPKEVPSILGKNPNAVADQVTYLEQRKEIINAQKQVAGHSKEYVKDYVKKMATLYQNADVKFGKDAIGYQAQMLRDLTNMTKGTSLNPNALINGDFSSLNDINDKDLENITKVTLDLRTKSIVSSIYNAPVDDYQLATLQASIQAADGLQKEQINQFKNAINAVSAEKNKSPKSVEEYERNKNLVTSFLNERGTMRLPSQAKEIFVANANKYFKTIPAHTKFYGKDVAEDVPAITPQEQASSYFETNVRGVLTSLDKKLIPFKTKSGYAGTGGEDMPEKSSLIEFSGKGLFSTQSQMVTKLFEDIGDNPQLVTIGAGSNKLIPAGGIKESQIHRQSFQNLLDKFKAEDTDNLNISTKWAVEPTQNVPNVSLFGNKTDNVLTPAVVIQVTVPENEFKKINGLKQDDVVKEEDRTYSVRVQADLSEGSFPPSIADFVAQTQLSPQEVYMQKVGSNINLNFGQKGSASLERVLDPNTNKPKLKVIKYVPFVTGDGEPIKVPEVIYLDNQNLSEAYSYITSGFNNIYKKSQQNAANYARSTKKQ